MGLLNFTGSGVQNNISYSHLGEFFGQRYQTFHRIGSHRYGQILFLGQGAHFIHIVVSGRIQQRTLESTSINGCFHNSWVFGHQHQIKLRGFSNFFGCIGKCVLIPSGIFERHQFRSKVQTHPFILKCIPGFKFGFEIRLSNVRLDRGSQQGGIIKGLFMTVLNRFPARCGGTNTFADGHRANRRRRGFCQLLPGFIRDVRAVVQFRFAGSQIHGKCQTGRHTAFLAVGFRQ